MDNFKTIIGLEIHVQLATKSKMFCRCDNDSDQAEPNTNVCPRCLGMPGMLPVANRQAIEWTIKTGLALGCSIPEESKFDRKHYFYPDLPKGYQISQYDQPLCRGGELKVKVEREMEKLIRLNRIHLEEDAGKLVHRGKDSLVDLNRAGTPLMEIVTEPCINSPLEAKVFLQELQLLVRYLGVSEASMEKGHLRCDANISVQKVKGEKPEANSIQGEKSSEIVEIKNLNSFKFVEKALQFEEKRLRDEYPNWPQNRRKVTRGFDSNRGITFPQRQKEEASDYRYFPEPDVPAIKVNSNKEKGKSIEGFIIDLEKIREEIGHSPESLRKYLVEKNLPEHVLEKIVSNPNHAWYLMDAPSLEKDLALWVTEEVNAAISAHKLSYEEYKKNVPITHLADLLSLLSAGKISNTSAKEVFMEMAKTGKRAVEIVSERGLEQVSDSGEIEKIVDQIISDNPKEAERLRAGEEKLIGFFVGQIMRQSKGKANPQMAAKILLARIRN